MRTVKLTLLLLSIAIPCVAADGPQAFGPLKFGMSREETDKASEKLLEESMRRRPPGDTVDSVRKNFVINGTRYPAKVTSKNKMPLALSFRRNPGAQTLASVYVISNKHDAASYDQAVKDAWIAMRDIAQSKFGPSKQEAGAGAFPSLAALQGSETIAITPKPPAGTVAARLVEDKKSIVTDVWETRDGVRVELSVNASLPEFLVTVVLKASK